MTIEIDKKIVGYEVLESEQQEQQDTEEVAAEEVMPDIKDSDSVTAEIIQMNEKLERPEMLLGSTY